MSAFVRYGRPIRHLDEETKAYFRNNRSNEVPLLTGEEEVALAKRIANGDGEAFNRMVEANLRLVVPIATYYVGCRIGLIDLIQEGNIGLMEAVRRFDH